MEESEIVRNPGFSGDFHLEQPTSQPEPVQMSCIQFSERNVLGVMGFENCTMSAQDKNRLGMPTNSSSNSFSGSSSNQSSPTSQSSSPWSNSLMSSIVTSFSGNSAANTGNPGNPSGNLIRDYNVWMPQSM